jgi:hypothetical protein
LTELTFSVSVLPDVPAVLDEVRELLGFSSLPVISTL